MMNNWTDTLTNLRKAAGAFAEANPPVVGAYRGLNEALGKGQALDAKTRELIALAGAVSARWGGCLAWDGAAAQQAGATAEEGAEARGAAVALAAGAAYVYSVRALGACGQFQG